MSELRELYQKAFDAFANQSYEEAITLYQHVIEVDEAFALARQGLSDTFLNSSIPALLDAWLVRPLKTRRSSSSSRKNPSVTAG